MTLDRRSESPMAFRQSKLGNIRIALVVAWLAPLFIFFVIITLMYAYRPDEARAFLPFLFNLWLYVVLLAWFGIAFAAFLLVHVIWQPRFVKETASRLERLLREIEPNSLVKTKDYVAARKNGIYLVASPGDFYSKGIYFLKLQESTMKVGKKTLLPTSDEDKITAWDLAGLINTLNPATAGYPSIRRKEDKSKPKLRRADKTIDGIPISRHEGEFAVPVSATKYGDDQYHEEHMGAKGVAYFVPSIDIGKVRQSHKKPEEVYFYRRFNGELLLKIIKELSSEKI